MMAINDSCLKCRTFDPKFTNNYRCATQSCPGNYMSYTAKRKYEKTLSDKGRKLTYALRHKPDVLRIELDSGGWTDITGVLIELNIQMFELDFIVRNNNKKRFEYNSTKKLIRACQGHSLNIDLGLDSAIPPIWLYHGTTTTFIDSIQKQGLLRMNRQHVHLSTDMDTAYNVGSRHGKPTIITIFAKCMVNDGAKFYKSTNGVW